MRPHIRAFFQTCAQVLPCPEPIVELGSFRVAGQEVIADLRPFFTGKKYIGCDMRPGLGVDRIENVQHLLFEDNEVGTFLLADTLEHVLNPFEAFEEVYRCLRSDGIVIFSSVMHFPIHSYPNDYWRFTPEAFRALARVFPSSAIFFGGDANFPHSVCGVAANADYDSRMIREVVQPVSRIQVSAPPQFEENSRQLVRHLASKLVGDMTGTNQTSSASSGGFDYPLCDPAWVLTTGHWLRGWVTAEDVETIEVCTEDRVLLRATLTQARPDLDERLNPQRQGRVIGFQEQIDLAGFGDVIGALKLVAVTTEGRKLAVCESAPGLMLGELQPTNGFTLHTFDERSDEDRRRAGRELVESIRTRGEPVVVDLGCGFRKQGNIGIDANAEGTHADLICKLGFETIPLDDESVDEMVCMDFLEHLPKAIYLERQQRMTYPIIELMNEIWRVLKPGGVFTSKTPCYPTVEVHQDPTHLSVWTLKSMDYFCGKYPIARLYGVKTNFEPLENRMDGFYLVSKLKKPIVPSA